MKKRILFGLLALALLLSACQSGKKVQVQSMDAGTTAPAQTVDASLYLPVLQTLSAGTEARGLYYDLDGNGVPELLVRYIEAETYKLEVWTLDEETPVQVAAKNMGPAREGAVSAVGTITKGERTYVVIRQEETSESGEDRQATIFDYDGVNLEQIQDQRIRTEDGVTEYYIDELPVEEAEFDAVALPLDGEETLLSSDDDRGRSLEDMVIEAGGEVPAEPEPTEPVEEPTEPETLPDEATVNVLYAQVLEELIVSSGFSDVTWDFERDYYEGCLYDLDGNGVRELVLLYQTRDYRAHAEVWTVAGGRAVCILSEDLVALAGGPNANVSLVRADGETYFCTFWENGSTSDWTNEWTLYRVNGSTAARVRTMTQVSYYDDSVSDHPLTAREYSQDGSPISEEAFRAKGPETWTQTLLIRFYSFEEENLPALTFDRLLVELAGGAPSVQIDASVAGYYVFVEMTDGTETVTAEFLEEIGMSRDSIFLLVREDGTAVIANFGEMENLTWDENGFTSDGYTVPFHLEGNYIILSRDGQTLTLERSDGQPPID